MFGTNHSKTHGLQRTIGTKQMKRVQNIRIKICKYNQVRLVLAVFTSSKLTLNYVTQARCKLDAGSK